MHVETLIANVRLHDREGLWQVGIADGRYVHLGRDFDGDAEQTTDAEGRLLLPGLVEPHTHIDKTYTWQRAIGLDDGEQGALRNAIDAMRGIKADRDIDAVLAAARRALNRAIQSGVCCLRSHLDLGSRRDLDSAMALLALRESYRDRISIEFTALGGTDTPELRELMCKALAAGVDCVGGAPALAADPLAALEGAFALAEEFGRPLDLHIDETEDPASPCLERLAELVVERGFRFRVSASHCCSLGFMPEEDRKRVLGKVRDAGIDLVSLPACNLLLMGRGRQPAPRGALPVRQALESGVNVCVGSDNVADPFHPLGDYDPLGGAALCGEVAQLDNPMRAFDLVCHAPARALGLQRHMIGPGNRADCFLLDTRDLRSAIAEAPLRTHVFFGGRLVLRQQLRQIWS